MNELETSIEPQLVGAPIMNPKGFIVGARHKVESGAREPEHGAV